MSENENGKHTNKSWEQLVEEYNAEKYILKGKTRQQVFQDSFNRGYAKGFASANYQREAHIKLIEEYPKAVSDAYEEGFIAGWDARKQEQENNNE